MCKPKFRDSITKEQMARVIMLYESALSILAYSPSDSQYMRDYAKSKCREALSKKSIAISGDIYGLVTPADAKQIPNIEGLR